MSNLLQQLENNEAILLMYLAGELPEPDRVEVEQMLVNDDALRAAMTELAALQADVGGLLARAESPAFTAPSRREASVRRVVRAMAAAREESPAAPAPLAIAAASADEPRPYRLRWVAYPIAAAAVLLVGIIIMSNRAPAVLPPNREVAIIDQQQMNAPTPRIFDQPSDPALDRIDDVEQQVLSLRSPEAGLFDPDNVDPDR
jgi:anti-sigma factor RsiW